MKLNNLLLAAVCTLSAVSTSAQSLNYKIEGDVTGLPDGTVLVLNPVNTVTQPDMASATVSNGKFSFSGTVAEPTGVYLMVKDSWYFKRLVLGDGSTIKVTGSAVPSERNGVPTYSIVDTKVSGSALTDKYNDAMNVRNYLDILYDSNYKVFEEYTTEYGKARVTGNKAKLDSLANTPLGRAQAKADSLFFKTADDTFHKAVMANKDNFLGPLTMISLFSYLTADQKSWYDEFSDEAKNSQYGKMVKESVCPDSKVGTAAPALNVVNDKGKKLTFKDLSKGKKYILIDFWASWCKPCRKEIPNVKAMYAKYKKKGFEVISISIDKKEADWRKALKEEQLAWPNFRDTDESLATAWKVQFVPTMYLLDADGKIVAENARGEVLQQKLAELFK